MRWFTKSRRTLRSPDVQFFQTATQEQRILLFVQKSNDEGLEFYYVGNVMPDRSTIIVSVNTQSAPPMFEIG
jgi:hypothetical protein